MNTIILIIIIIIFIIIIIICIINTIIIIPSNSVAERDHLESSATSLSNSCADELRRVQNRVSIQYSHFAFVTIVGISQLTASWSLQVSDDLWLASGDIDDLLVPCHCVHITWTEQKMFSNYVR